MEISPFNIIKLVLTSLALGGVMGSINDIQKLIRALVFYENANETLSSKIELDQENEAPLRKRKAWILYAFTFIQDILFFALMGIGIVIINYYFNNGRFRIYAPVSAFIGFLIYYLTVGRIWDKIHNSIAGAFRRLILMILAIIFKPITIVCLFFGIIVKKFCKKVYKTIAKRQKKVYNKNKVKQVVKNASLGFVEPATSSIRGIEDDRKKIL